MVTMEAGGVVGDGEAVDFDVADGEGCASLEAFDDGVAGAPVESGGGAFGEVDGLFEGAGDGDEAEDVVGVLVGDDDGVEFGDVLADGCEAGGGFLAGESGVDEDAGGIGADEGAVAGAAGRQYADFQDCRTSWMPGVGGSAGLFLL